MKPLVFVTGNINKANELQHHLEIDVEHHALDLYEIQSLDLHEVLEAKAREAYTHLKCPVVVDDTSLIFEELNGLPGPLVKWFDKSIGNEGLCRLADMTKNRKAIAEVGIGYCDGNNFIPFISRVNGTISNKPLGDNGYGWDPIFIQEGYSTTRAQLSDSDYHEASIRQGALNALKSYLENR